MPFPNSPLDGDTYTDPNTKKNYVYSSSNSLWKIKNRSQVKDYSSLSASISTPTVGDSLGADASGTDYAPVSSLSNTFQSRREYNTYYTPPVHSFFSPTIYPSGSIGVNEYYPSPNQSLRIKASAEEIVSGGFSNTFSGSPTPTNSLLTVSPGQGVSFSMKFTGNSLYRMSYTNFYIYTQSHPNYSYPSNTNPTNRILYNLFVIKGREIDQSVLDLVGSNSTSFYFGEGNTNKVISCNSSYVTGSSSISTTFYDQNLHSLSYGDDVTVLIYCLDGSSLPLELNYYPTATPTQNNFVTVPTNLTGTPPAGYTAPTNYSGVSNLYLNFQTGSTAYYSDGRYRSPNTPLTDYIEGRTNQIPFNQRMEFLSAPETPVFTEFLPDGYTIYNSTTSQLNYWDSLSNSWIAA